MVNEVDSHLVAMVAWLLWLLGCYAEHLNMCVYGYKTRSGDLPFLSPPPKKKCGYVVKICDLVYSYVRFKSNVKL